MIKENIQKVNENIKKACDASKRSINDVKLIAVSKTQPVELIKEAYQAGIRDFGENKVQEILEKYEHMPSDTRWHMIGHLQTNKVKYIIDKVVAIHSVDSLKLARVISKEAVKNNIVMPIFLEINVAEEESKFGMDIKEVISAVKDISELPNIKIEGLMTVAPYVENPEENRQYFAILKQLSVDMINKNIDNKYGALLSMGMTNDYMVAIEEGADYIRVGTGIFGNRNYFV